MSQLAFRYKYDDSFFDAKLNRDDFGWLAVFASSDHFQGRGGFWVQWQDVREFGEALAPFPISPDAPIVAQWGYNAQDGEDVIVRVEIAPVDLRGNLRVSFEIADLHETQNRVRSSFLTNYPDVQAFSGQIAELMDGKLSEAILHGRCCQQTTNRGHRAASPCREGMWARLERSADTFPASGSARGGDAA